MSAKRLAGCYGWELAHSGADLNTPPPPEVDNGATPGEVPNSFPTVYQQLTMPVVTSLGAPVSPGDVDLLLVDGCTNDVGIASILNPDSSESVIAAKTMTACSSMEPFLAEAHKTYPGAKIIVTGYYPIVSPTSDLTAISVLMANAGIFVAPAVAATFGIPLDPVTGAILGFEMSQALEDKLVSHSVAFVATATAALGTAVNRANATAGGYWSTFVQPPFQDINA